MADAQVSQFARGYHSFSGVDIKAVFNNVVIGEIQAISYSVTREKAPLYTMGSADPRSFSRGKRGIAGTLIFLMFDRHPILGTFGDIARKNGQPYLPFMSDKDDFIPNTSAGEFLTSIPIATVDSPDAPIDWNLYASTLGESNITSVDGDQQFAAAWFADQLPPFDITLAAANEYGSFAVMRVYGAELLNEGYGVSIDDIVSEMQHTYVARTISPWQPVVSAKTDQLYTAGNSTAS